MHGAVLSAGTLLTGGEASRVLLRTIRGVRVVEKTSTRADLRREALALGIARRAGVPVPRLRARRGGTLYLGWVPGRNATAADASFAFRDILTELLRCLHTVALPGVGELDALKPSGAASWRRFLDVRTDAALRALRERKTVTAADARALRRQYARLADKGVRDFTPTLVHGDLHLDNLRITPGGQVVLLDFEDAFAGDGLYDLAGFRHFHPRLAPALVASYLMHPTPEDLRAFRLYRFVHALTMAAFDAGVGNDADLRRALRTVGIRRA